MAQPLRFVYNFKVIIFIKVFTKNYGSIIMLPVMPQHIRLSYDTFSSCHSYWAHDFGFGRPIFLCFIYFAFQFQIIGRKIKKLEIKGRFQTLDLL